MMENVSKNVLSVTEHFKLPWFARGPLAARRGPPGVRGPQFENPCCKEPFQCLFLHQVLAVQLNRSHNYSYITICVNYASTCTKNAQQPLFFLQFFPGLKTRTRPPSGR